MHRAHRLSSGEPSYVAEVARLQMKWKTCHAAAEPWRAQLLI